MVRNLFRKLRFAFSALLFLILVQKMSTRRFFTPLHSDIWCSEKKFYIKKCVRVELSMLQGSRSQHIDEKQSSVCAEHTLSLLSYTWRETINLTNHIKRKHHRHRYRSRARTHTHARSHTHTHIFLALVWAVRFLRNLFFSSHHIYFTSIYLLPTRQIKMLFKHVSIGVFVGSQERVLLSTLTALRFCIMVS